MYSNEDGTYDSSMCEYCRIRPYTLTYTPPCRCVYRTCWIAWVCEDCALEKDPQGEYTEPLETDQGYT